MAQSYYHAQASSKKYGGTPEDYLPIHEWIDQFKSTFGDVRHRALLHHAKGPWMAQEVFGQFIEIEKAGGGKKKVMVRDIAESHIVEDLGWLPAPSDWLSCMDCKVWMGGKKQKFIGREEVFNSTVKEAK